MTWRLETYLKPKRACFGEPLPITCVTCFPGCGEPLPYPTGPAGSPRCRVPFPLQFEEPVMPDARGVEGPQARPSLRAAVARRPLRKPGEPVPPPSPGAGTVTTPPPAAPARTATIDRTDRAERA